mmetsp:Transcript_9171/g.27294  ORF Transcript_9171/g.27294 Transcript_9171/m.27294 type:complete len:1071 (-) Transcript_9171:43-3255(-)
MNHPPVAKTGRMSSNHPVNPGPPEASGDSKHSTAVAKSSEQQQPQQQQPQASDESSSWNVVVSRRPAPSAKPPPARSKQGRPQSQSRAGAQKSWHTKQQQQQQQQQQQRHAKKGSTPSINNNNTKPQKNNNYKSQKNNINNNNSNSNRSNNKNNNNNNAAKQKAKPKPKVTTVGDMLRGKAKKQGNDEKKKTLPQHQQQQQQRQQPPRQQPNLHTSSIEDFPALGASDFPALGSKSASEAISSESAAPATARKGWGVVPRPPPAPVLSPSAGKFAPSMAASSPPFRKKPQGKPQIAGVGQPQILKRGDLPPRAVSATTGSKKKKASKTESPASQFRNNAVLPAGAFSAASFFQPRLRKGEGDQTGARFHGANGMEGEEHQLLRLLQERTIYQKKGRQRVAPRKKKFTALKKKVLQERVNQWRALHPAESTSEHDKSGDGTNDDLGVQGNSLKDAPPATHSLCLYNYAGPEELEDDDEYEEIIDNLGAMAGKIGPTDEVFIPRSPIAGEEANPESDNSKHPAFVRFRNLSDAAAALACWSGLVIGGSKLEVVGIHVPADETPWSESVLAAETKRRSDSASAEQSHSEGEPASSIKIVLQKVLTEDDFEDEDCMKESIGDLEKIAMQFGEVRDLKANEAKNGDVAVTYHCTLAEARSIAEKLCRVVLGGQPLYASVSEQPSTTAMKAAALVLLENILTEEDLEDSDCLQESLNDIRELCGKHGDVSDVVVRGKAVKVTYREERMVAERAAHELNGIVLGGNTIRASVLVDEASEVCDDGIENVHSIDLHNLITEDDLEDEECLEESLRDVRELASKYGQVAGVDVSNTDSIDGAFVRIQFGGDHASGAADNALQAFNGMVIGGQIIAASRSNAQPPAFAHAVPENPGDKRKPHADTNHPSDKKARTDDKEPLYSGDKLISERFAEMKRVPKVPNKGPREYASAVNDEHVKPLLSEMLGELMRLQKRAMEDKNAKARRRMVMGLREVARGIRAHKVKMVVMANNLDDYGVIDQKLQEIIDLAKSEGVPLFFEFTKRSLGRAIGKNIKIAVVGIQNADGAHQPFKKLNALARTL